MLTRFLSTYFVEGKYSDNDGKDSDDEENVLVKVVESEEYLESDEVHVSDCVEPFVKVFVPGMVICILILFLAWVYVDIGKLMYLLF